MSRLRTAVVVLAMTGVLAGCGQLDLFSAPPPSSAAPTSSSEAATSSSAAATTTPPSSVAPVTVVESGAGPVAAPRTWNGSGNGVLTVAKPPGASAVIATIVGNAAGKNFDVRAIDGAQDHLVATTSPYRGSTLLDTAGTTTHQLRVHAVGAWSITLTDVRSAPSFTIGYRGTGDAVLLHVGRGGSGLVVAEGSGAFVVRSYRAGHATALASATAPWSGNLRWSAGDAIVTVRAAGPWSITVDHR